MTWLRLSQEPSGPYTETLTFVPPEDGTLVVGSSSSRQLLNRNRTVRFRPKDPGEYCMWGLKRNINVVFCSGSLELKSLFHWTLTICFHIYVKFCGDPCTFGNHFLRIPSPSTPRPTSVPTWVVGRTQTDHWTPTDTSRTFTPVSWRFNPRVISPGDPIELDSLTLGSRCHYGL